MVCLSPTYELALQTGQVAEKMGQFCPEIKIGYAVRGERGEKFYQKKIELPTLYTLHQYENSPYCSVYIFLSAEKENLFSNQRLL